jgi:hypothetical protein
MGLPLHIIWFFFFIAFSILSLFSALIVLTIIWSGEVPFWLCLFGDLEGSCTWLISLCQDLGNLLLLFCWIYFLCLWLALLIDAYDSQVWSFDRVAEFLYIPFAACETFVYVFFWSLFTTCFVFKLWNPVLYLFQSAEVTFNSIFYLTEELISMVLFDSGFFLRLSIFLLSISFTSCTAFFISFISF